MTTSTHTIVRALQAGTRALQLLCTDEGRALELLEAVGEQLDWPVHTWSASSGVDRNGRAVRLLELVTARAHETEPALWILFDPGPALADPATLRAVREVAQRSTGPALVLVDPDPRVADRPLSERIPELWVEALPAMDRTALRAHLTQIAAVLDDSGYEGATEAFGAALPSLLGSCLGLPRTMLDRLLAEAVLEHGLDLPAIERFVARAKPSALDPAGMLTPVTPARLDEVGGLQRLKTWLARRALAFEDGARQAGIPEPRGVLLLGVQGCGKSLAARASASALGLPLVRLDPGRLFGGTVGESEANLRRALDAIERIAPVVVWLDEIDKGLAGSEATASDAGTTARVVGGLLTWLQERERPAFVVATANRVDALPPELLRRGRLDEIFFLDLPGADEREAIVRVHLELTPQRRFGVTPPTADPFPAFAEIARAAEGFSGAELESALVEARLEAYAAARDLKASDFASAVASTVPLSVVRSEEVQALRAWARHRARLG